MFSLTAMTQQNQEFMTFLCLHLNQSVLDMSYKYNYKHHEV